MAEAPRPGGLDTRFDRVPKPEPGGGLRDRMGKEALYSTAPTAAPTRPLQVTCRRCAVSTPLTFVGALRLLRPPFLLNPLTGTMWTCCPSCGRRTWVDASTGQALRALLHRGSGRSR